MFCLPSTSIKRMFCPISMILNMYIRLWEILSLDLYNCEQKYLGSHNNTRALFLYLWEQRITFIYISSVLPCAWTMCLLPCILICVNIWWHCGYECERIALPCTYVLVSIVVTFYLWHWSTQTGDFARVHWLPCCVCDCCCCCCCYFGDAACPIKK